MGAAFVRALAAAWLLLVAAPAGAQDNEPRFCPNRPDLGASGCTTLPGQVQVELSGIDWERADDADEREDTILYGDLLARFGLDGRTELQLGWAPLVSVRTRDKASGMIEHRHGVGDVRVAVRRNIANPDGSGLSPGIEPFVVLPTSSNGVGDGTWSAGVQVPVSFELNDRWSIGFTGEASAQADEDRHGRHANVNGVAGLGYAISDAVSATVELYAERDDDPADRSTILLTAVSAAWQPTARTQLDVLAVAGLNHDAPDVRIVLGGAILF